MTSTDSDHHLPMHLSLQSPSTSTSTRPPVFSPSLARLLSDEGEGRAGPGPRTQRSWSSGGLGLRKRRLVGQVLGLVLLGCFGVIWIYGVRNTLSLNPWTTVGSGSSVNPDAIGSEESHHPNWPDLTPPTPIQTWGVDLSSSQFLSGISPWPQNPPTDPDSPPLSSLGHFADEIYLLGPMTRDGYTAQLYEFATVAFPPDIAEKLKRALHRYLGSSSGLDASRDGGGGGGGVNVEIGVQVDSWNGNKNVWQTDKDASLTRGSELTSWRYGQAQDEGWQWDLLTDKEADKYVSRTLGGSKMELVWNSLPSGILRSDTIRYMLLLLEGGIYSDTDTQLLKSPSDWGRGANLWRDGGGWLDDVSMKQIQKGDTIDHVLGPPSVVVGIEADVGEREDWYEWWPRPIQIVQWTMGSAPYHPIALAALLRILHSTAEAIDWAHDHEWKIRKLKELGRYQDAKGLLETTVLHEPKMGGAVSVMSWTGPSVWTDAVLNYLRVKYGLIWTDLRNIRHPVRIGDVLVLPVTGFSPGVGQFGSKPTWDPEAMVQHAFRGSWKTEAG